MTGGQKSTRGLNTHDKDGDQRRGDFLPYGGALIDFSVIANSVLVSLYFVMFNDTSGVAGDRCGVAR